MSEDEQVVSVSEEERLRDCSVALTQMYLGGQVDEDVLAAKRLQLARDWVGIDRKQEARDLLAQISDEYFTSKMPAKMRTEPDFHKLVHELALAFGDDASKVDDSEIDLAILRGPVAQA